MFLRDNERREVIGKKGKLKGRINQIRIHNEIVVEDEIGLLYFFPLSRDHVLGILKTFIKPFFWRNYNFIRIII